MHIGLYCPVETGHLNTMLPIGEALLLKGHRVTFVGIPDAQARVEALGIHFFPVAMESFPQGSIEKIFETLGKREGLSALLYTIGIFRHVSYMVLQDGAIACKDLKLDGMVIDQTSTEAVAIAMGTLQNRLKNTFQTIAAACENLDIQLVISLGGSANPEDLPPLPGHPLVVRYAPQIELLQRASLTITHGGMNTTIESLTHGVPLVAIPITNDQPGVAARIQWSGCGEFLELKQLTVQKLREKVKRVLEVPSYRDCAQQFQQEINHSGGINQAIAIIEQAISTQQPVVDCAPVIFDNFSY